MSDSRERRVSFAQPNESELARRGRSHSLERRRPLPLPASSFPPGSSLPLTFGIEMEYIFAINTESQPGYEWFFGDPDYFPSAGAQNGDKRYTLEDAKLLYLFEQVKEPEYLGSQRALSHGGLQSELFKDNPSSWVIHDDCSVYPKDDEELLAALGPRMRNGVENWISSGAELVSRVLTAPDTSSTRQSALSSDPSIKEIHAYLNALHGSPQDPFGAYTNETCGLHIHIGLDPKKTPDGTALLPLPVLQHLAYMLVHFESLISSLHPYSRRATYDPEGGTSHLLGSNLMGLKFSNHICGSPSLPMMQEVEAAIFHRDMTHHQLAYLMSETGLKLPQHRYADRYKFVNFKRILDATNPKACSRLRRDMLKTATIEFRQHEGSLDIEDISRWIQFVVALVRAAETKAVKNQPATPLTPKTPGTLQKNLEIHMALPVARQQGNKYRIRCKKQADEFERLFDLLEFDRLTRRYWLERYKKFNPDEILDSNEREWDCVTAGVKREECPKCVKEERQRVQAELIIHHREDRLRRIEERLRMSHELERFYTDMTQQDLAAQQEQESHQIEQDRQFELWRLEQLDKQSWLVVELDTIGRSLPEGQERDLVETQLENATRLIEMLQNPTANLALWERFFAYVRDRNATTNNDNLLVGHVIDPNTISHGMYAGEIPYVMDQNPSNSSIPSCSTTNSSPSQFIPGAYPSSMELTPESTSSFYSDPASHLFANEYTFVPDMNYQSFPAPTFLGFETRYVEEIDDDDDDSDQDGRISGALAQYEYDGETSEMSMDISEGHSPIAEISDALFEMDVC